MSRFKLFFCSAALFMLPLIVGAQGVGQGLATEASGGVLGLLLKNILAFTQNVLIPFVLGIGFLAFVWGMFYYFIAGGADSEKREQGKQLMIYAIVGFLIIILFFGVINFLVETTGLRDDALNNLPTIPSGTPPRP